MAKIICLLFLLTVFLFYLPLVNPALALGPPPCQNKGVIIEEDVKPTYNIGEPIKIKLGIDPAGDFARKELHFDWTYDVVIVFPAILSAPPRTEPKTGKTLAILAKQDRLPLEFSKEKIQSIYNPDTTYTLEFDTSGSGITTGGICTGPSFKINPYNPFPAVSCQPDVPQEILANHKPSPAVYCQPDGILPVIDCQSDSVLLNITPRNPDIIYSFLIYKGKMDNNLFKLQTKESWTYEIDGKYNKLNQQPIVKNDEDKDIPELGLGDYTLVIKAESSTSSWAWGCSVNQFSAVNNNPAIGKAPGGPAPGAGAAAPGGTSPAPIPAATACTDPKTCSLGGGDPCTVDPKNPGFKTAIGCIHTNPAVLVKDLMTFVIGIGGGIAFLLMLMGAFQMLTSAGNPDHLNAGRERLTNAVIGLLFIIFAVLLLQIVGVGILAIPGFK